MKTFFYSVIVRLLIMAVFITVLVSCGGHGKTAYDRYVVLSPEVAEILAHLGVGYRIVGRTAECDYPRELQDIEVIGNFGQISLERVVALNPSIVFASALEQDEIAEQLQRLNIRTVQFYPHNTAELLSVIRELGEICGVVEKADSLAAYLDNRFSHFREIADSRESKPRVFIEIYGNPIMSASNGSYVGQLLLYAGAENIFPELIRDYARVNAEDVVHLNPDIIILTYPGINANDVQNRRGWGNVNAVRNNRIYTIYDVNPDLLLRATPRNIKGIERLKLIMDNG